MYKKKSKTKELVIYGSIFIVLFILITISLLVQKNGNDENNILKNASMFIEKIVMYPFTALNPEKGKDQSESYIIQKNVNSSLEKEIQELKDALELNKTLTEYTPINATILWNS